MFCSLAGWILTLSIHLFLVQPHLADHSRLYPGRRSRPTVGAHCARRLPLPVLFQRRLCRENHPRGLDPTRPRNRMDRLESGRRGSGDEDPVRPFSLRRPLPQHPPDLTSVPTHQPHLTFESSNRRSSQRLGSLTPTPQTTPCTHLQQPARGDRDSNESVSSCHPHPHIPPSTLLHPSAVSLRIGGCPKSVEVGSGSRVELGRSRLWRSPLKVVFVLLFFCSFWLVSVSG